MSDLQEALKNYLTMRRGLGFTLLRSGKALFHFVSFLEQKDALYITTALALEWALKPCEAKPATWAGRLGYVRGFAQYMSAVDPRTEIPSTALLPHRAKRAQPYLYTENEIQQLMTAALNLPIATSFPAASFLKRRTYHCLIGLLSVTGMRISEVIGLKMKNVDLEAGILTIEGAKLGKSRLIPFHASTQKALSKYKLCREQFLDGHPADHFFINQVGKSLDQGTVRRTFYILSRAMGLRGLNSRQGPRIHDMRHRFAVQTLLQWYRNGENVERMLPVLSTYLGHVHVSDTYWYLTAYPELMGHAVERLEQSWEGKP
jgi:integrase/recombinase XerD